MGRALMFSACICLCLLLEGPAPVTSPAAAGSGPSAAPPPLYPPLHTDLSDYLWPTDAGRIVTSTFAEFRRSHFHGGIDVSTGDDTGFRVFASRDGYVSRIRVSPVGYGKMLYVRQSDGYTTTYAHLKRFAGAIEERCELEQRRLLQYPVDIDCSPGELPVRKGDVIAYTGESGTGSPHLHFEIRDENLNAVNPLLCDHFQCPDHVAPVIRKVAVVPVGPESVVDGEPEAAVLTPRKRGTDRWSVSGQVHITGAAGIEIDVRDKAEGSRFYRSVYRNRLFVDDSLLVTTTLDRAPMNYTSEISLFYDWQLLDEGRGRFVRLYLRPPEGLPFYSPQSDSAGILRAGVFPPGLHRFTVQCEDFNGNRATVDGQFIVDRRPRVDLAPAEGGVLLTFPDPAGAETLILSSRMFGNGGWTSVRTPLDSSQRKKGLFVPLDRNRYDIVRVEAESEWGTRSYPRYFFADTPKSSPGSLTIGHSFSPGFVRVTVAADGIIVGQPSVSVIEGSVSRTIPIHAEDLDRYAGAFVPCDTVVGTRKLIAEATVNGSPARAEESFTLYPVAPGAAGRLPLDGGKLVLAYDSAAVYSPLLLRVVESNEGGDHVYSLEPARTALKNGFSVTATPDPLRPNAGLYFRARSSWVMIAPPTGGMKPLTGTLTHTLGDLALLVDDAPPVISRLRITGLRSRRPAITFRFRDNLSGIEYEELKTYIDTVGVVPEIDGEHHRASVRIDSPLAPGSHQITIRLKDKSGNTGTLERRFVVR